MKRIYDVVKWDDFDIIALDELTDLEVETYRYYHLVVYGPMEAWWNDVGHDLYRPEF